ncbi:MAG: carbohydrate binding domain-containing protein [Acidobacteria bacterium]|nr:carbohydrate binding domain-containing protein [Acidobacteriota bacterium]
MRRAMLLVSITCAVWGQCGAPLVEPTADFAWLIGGLPDGAAAQSYRWLRNGQLLAAGSVPQRFLLRADESARTSAGAMPLAESRVAFAPGRWGSALAVASGGSLAYARQGHLDLNEGAIEMWVAARAPGTDPVYADRDHVLFQYRAANGDELRVAQSRTIGVMYGGGNVRGQWQSAYGSQASTRAWAAGEWHHVVFTWSAAENFMRFYVDGVRTADTNERHYWPPEATADRFLLGAEQYLIDEVRIFSRPLSPEEIRLNAQRAEAPRHNEVWLSLAQMAAGDRLALEYEGCAPAAYRFTGIPIVGADPPSTLLPPGTTDLEFRLRTTASAACRWSLGELREFERMTPFESGKGSSDHRTRIAGLAADTTVVNDVWVRCDNEPSYALRRQYRSLPEVSPRFPRKGNLWGTGQLMPQGLEHAARIDLHLGASFTPAEIRRLRALNPNVLVLTSINVVENSGLPEDYYLHDTTGSRIEVWPGTYRLNLTKQYVAEYQARYAYERILESGLMVDGCFFDNFFTTQSWLKADIHGRQLSVDADEDGRPDDPAWLDRVWKEGVYHELRTWRALMPHALASGHLPRPPAAEFAEIFNGDSIGFMTADAIEGKRPFADLWRAYHDWWRIGRPPALVMVESSPHDQIAYGYDYSPLQKTPPSTLEFARTYYPNVRFGLAFTLMNDGFFAHEFGDTWHGNDWWYDELDFDLGYPLGAARRVEVDGFTQRDRIDNGGFEMPLEGSWGLSLNTTQGAAATLARDATEAAEGTASARITITNAGNGTNWHIDFSQRGRSLTAGQSYDLEFWAKAGAPRPISLSSQKGSPDWRNYGLTGTVTATAEWQRFVVPFEARETVDDSRIQFFLGAQTGTVWIDGVRLVEHAPDVYRRDFDHGVALLNGSRQRLTIAVGPGFRRLTGEQAPRHEYLLDDSGPEFSATPEWKPAAYDSGEWKSAGPFFHDWGQGCRRNDSTAGEARWDLALRGDDTYTITAWWPAAPEARNWSRRVVCEVVSGGKLVASTVFDQTTGGDEWHTLATLPLTAADKPFVRVRNEGTGAAIADALHVRSAARYNDGSPVESVTLEPMDGIVLRRAN